MKKNLLLVFALISTFGFSQESIFDIINYSGGKKIITTTTACNSSNYLCSLYLDELSSQSTGSIEIKRNGSVYNPSNANSLTISGGHSYTLNGVTFSEINNNSSTYGNYINFDTSGGGTGTSLIGNYTWQDFSWSGEETGAIANDGKAKTLWYEIDLPQSFVDNLLEGDEVRVLNRQADFSGSGSFANGGDLLVLKKIAGQLIVASSNGYNQVSLSVSEIEKSKNNLVIYPNPTNNFITIQNRQNSTENYDYKIVDLTGRVVKSGNSKFNEQINIEGLENGNYIIQTQTEREKFIEKLIKN